MGVSIMRWKEGRKAKAKAIRRQNVGHFGLLWQVGVLGLVIFVMSSMSGCNKLVKIQEEKQVDRAVVNRQVKSVQSMEEMIVPKTFNWNTAQRIQMGLNLRSRSGEGLSGVQIRVYYKDNVRKDLHEMVNGISNKEGKVGTTFNIPTYVKSVYVKTNQTGDMVFEIPVDSYEFDYTLRL